MHPQAKKLSKSFMPRASALALLMHVLPALPSLDMTCACVCRKAHINRTLDKELVYLKIYLLKIAQLESLTGLQHKKWERYIAEDLRHPRGSR